MCGEAINWLHTILIGPVIIVSTYYDWKLPLYLLGGLAILVHGYYMHKGTSSEKLMKKSTVGYLFATKGKFEPTYQSKAATSLLS